MTLEYSHRNRGIIPGSTSPLAGLTPRMIQQLQQMISDGTTPEWLIGETDVELSEGAAWDISIDVEGEKATFRITVPPGGEAYWRGGTQLASDADIYSLPTGVYSVWERPRATALGLPTETQGILEVFRYGASGGILRWTTRQVDAPSQVWQTQALSSTKWDDWVRVDVGATYNYWRGSSMITGYETLEDLPTGVYTVWGAEGAALGLPTTSQGVLEVFRYGTNGGIAVWRAWVDGIAQVWQAHHFPSGFQPWQRIDARGITPPAPSPSVSPSGFKRVPLAVTLGNGGGVEGALTGAVRYALHFNAPVTRWRLHVANRNARSGATRAGTITFTDWSIGTEQAAGGIGSPETIIDGFTTDGTGWTSRWLTAPIGTGTPLLLATTYNSSVAPYLQVGACWRGTTEANLAQHVSAPFEVWIEAETPARTGVVAVVGSSSDAGVGGARPVVDSTLSRWSRANGALPVHYAHSGDGMGASLDPGAYKWARWADLDRPDSVLLALGSNDVYTAGITLAELQERQEQLTQVAAERISSTQYAATIFRRANGESDLRVAYNAWLMTHPNGMRDVYDFAAAIGSPPDPAYDADGVHINDSGFTALLGTITRPLTAPAL